MVYCREFKNHSIAQGSGHILALFIVNSCLQIIMTTETLSSSSKIFYFQLTLEMNILIGVTLEMKILQLNILRRKMSRTPVVISR